MMFEEHRCRGIPLLTVRIEARAPGSAHAQARELFERLTAGFDHYGTQLGDVVRTRLWAVDRHSRDVASGVRRAILTGPSRAASSSYIAPAWFASDAAVGIEATARVDGAVGKVTVEHDPPRIPIRYLTWGELVVMSGVTTVLPTLPEQLDANLAKIDEMFEEAGNSWNRAVDVRAYLHSSCDPEQFRALLDKRISASVDLLVVPVDGYSAVGKLVELEVTALR